MQKGNFPGMGNSPGMSHIPQEYYGNGNAIFKAEIFIFPGMGFSRGMGMRPHGNGNSRTSHISGSTSISNEIKRSHSFPPYIRMLFIFHSEAKKGVTT